MATDNPSHEEAPPVESAPPLVNRLRGGSIMHAEVNNTVAVVIVLILVVLLGGAMLRSAGPSGNPADQDKAGLRKPGEKPIRPSMGGGNRP